MEWVTPVVRARLGMAPDGACFITSTHKQPVERLRIVKDKSEVVQAGLRALIAKRSAELLAEMGVSDPGAGAPPLRRVKRANRDATLWYS